MENRMSNCKAHCKVGAMSDASSVRSHPTFHRAISPSRSRENSGQPNCPTHSRVRPDRGAVVPDDPTLERWRQGTVPGFPGLKGLPWDITGKPEPGLLR